MSILSSGDFFALDIGSSAIRVVHLHGTGKTKNLVRYGEMPIDGKIAESDSENDRARLAQAITKVVADSNIGTRDVVVGIPSRSMFTTVVDMPNLPHDDLEKTIKYQADQHIPMSIDEAEFDWGVLGASPVDQTKVEVLLASVAKGYAESRLDLLESIGLNVVAIEPDGVALSRALTLSTGVQGAVMLLDIGAKATDLIIAMEGGPRLIRGIPTGGNAFVKAAKTNLNIDEKQAQQFVYKFGLNQNKLEGQVFKALEGVVDGLMTEIEKSIKFFNTRYKNVPLEKIVVTGGASTLPEFPLHLANKIGVKVEIGNAWQNVSYPNNMYNELISVSNHFSVAVGLALRGLQ